MSEVAKNGNLKMAIFIDLKVATNGNYVLHDQSCQKWQSLLASKLPKMATTCFMTKVTKNGNYSLYDKSCQKWQ